MLLFLHLLLASSIIFHLALSASLPASEVEALREIGKRLGKEDWDFSVDPCSGNSGWVSSAENSVTCSTANDTVTIPHVVSIVLKMQNLQGTLPPELVKLPHLQEFDLTRNYLSGTIPPQWGSMKLVNISLLGNRLTGSIPKEIGNISTLIGMTVEFNRLSGILPPELGNLTRIERLFLSSNNFTGELPATFARLTSLKDFRINDCNLSGKIPNFIQNWTNIKKLTIQASGLMGPIPSSISALTQLTDLRISDLNGNNPSPFPPVNSMQNLKRLMLRSCNIIGELPVYLGRMTTLKILDLSFNQLSGDIPSSYSDLLKINFVYFTGNSLTGEVPSWMLAKGDNIDLSYNNLSATSPEASHCQHQGVNLFDGFSPGDKSGTVSCLKSTTCPKKSYSLYINCGGRDAIADGKAKYEEDTNPAGPSRYVQSASNWAFSSTGNFLDDDRTTDTLIFTNQNVFTKDSELFINARLSPVSLTYYGFCMGDGNYTVNLHFMEIMFTDDKTYSSLGRRIFDIYIQGKLVRKDFNIADEAGGVGKAIIKKFPAVVTNGTLEIRLYWAGKGTTDIPQKGTYGPLISAISVISDFTPPSETSVSVGMVVGIVIGVAFVIFLITGIILWLRCFKQKNTLEQGLNGLDLQTGSFSLRQIKAATNNFDLANKIGEGGFGPVYKGHLIDGKVIAVKLLSARSKQGNREFLNEIGMISALQHPHLVKLYGCCIEGNQLMLVYEYLENNSLARALFGPADSQSKIDWLTRQKICIGIAKGLAFLHEESRLKIVHRDIKAANILLDKDLNPKISDFGLAKLDESDNTHIITRIAGTLGYMAPEYAMRGHLSDKADVYSFGIVALEIVSGRSNTFYRANGDCSYLLDWALLMKEKGNILEFVDPRLESSYNKQEVMNMIDVALLCTQPAPAVRPAMSSVVSMLEGKVLVKELGADSGMSIESMRNFYKNLEGVSVHESQTPSTSSVSFPFTSSSTCTVDHLNVHSV